MNEPSPNQEKPEQTRFERFKNFAGLVIDITLRNHPVYQTTEASTIQQDTNGETTPSDQ